MTKQEYLDNYCDQCTLPKEVCGIQDDANRWCVYIAKMSAAWDAAIDAAKSWIEEDLYTEPEVNSLHYTLVSSKHYMTIEDLVINFVKDLKGGQQ